MKGNSVVGTVVSTTVTATVFIDAVVGVSVYIATVTVHIHPAAKNLNYYPANQ